LLEADIAAGLERVEGAIGDYRHDQPPQ